ncbi:hypothetical protein GCM10011317_48250 [Niveispirillum cyanobacteriorum]|nr:hypothetical protein GCM10011317_48250 [Niveispirillum cyanobacteriorum]
MRCIVVINNSSAFEPTSPYIQWALGFVSGAHASVLEIALADGAVIDQQTADQAAIAASRIARRGETRISIDVRDKCEKDPSLKLADAVKSAMEDWFD